MHVTIGWCSEFRPRWGARALLHANRPPSLFVHELAECLTRAGTPAAASLVTDENLGERVMQSNAINGMAQSDIVFLSSHGRVSQGLYRFRLRQGEWTPIQNFDPASPPILVLDTCDVVEASCQVRAAGWLSPDRQSPALVLGFVEAASDGYHASTRGTAFARNLAYGLTFANAWINAVRDTDPSHKDCPIAIAFGESEPAAQQTLDFASLTNMPSSTVATACRWKTI